MENTTKLFADIQAAYEVLSDSQERAWYDAHREEILQGTFAPSGEFYEGLTTTDDITRMYVRFDGQLDVSDGPLGFYSTVRQFFEQLAEEERSACERQDLRPIDHASFGLANDSYDGVVKPFYACWANFTTRKTFAWKDVFRYSEAPDRRVRRMMERENKRVREESMREFNQSVRALAVFLKKRDPRYAPPVQSTADRQKSLRDVSAAQAAKSKAANEANLVPDPLPLWARASNPSWEDQTLQDENEGLEKRQPIEHIECVICQKIFKSEQQYQAHEKSKKHSKSLRQAQKEMQNEAAALSFRNEVDNSSVADCNKNGPGETLHGTPYRDESDENVDTESAGDQQSCHSSDSIDRPLEDMDETEVPESISVLSASAAGEIIKKRLSGDAADGLQSQHATALEAHTYTQLEAMAIKRRSGKESSPHRPVKVGKAKQKRAKKAADKTSATDIRTSKVRKVSPARMSVLITRV